MFLCEAETTPKKWKEKLKQLETLMRFTMQRWADRTGGNINTDVTAVVGVAGLLLSPLPRESRASSADAATALVQRRATATRHPLIHRLLRAGRVFVMVLDESQMGLTTAQRVQAGEVSIMRRSLQAMASSLGMVVEETQ